MKIRGVTDTITIFLREQIMTGDLRAGVKLNEIELSESLGVSRPPLREAFRTLEQEKLVVSIPRRGVHVAEISIMDCEQVFHAREMIEHSAIDIIKKLTTHNLLIMKRSLEHAREFSLPTSMRSREMLDYFRVMADFHVKLVEASENNWLIHFYKMISPSLARYQIMYLLTADNRDASMTDHNQILEFLMKGSSEDAKQVLTSHIGRIVNLYREQHTQQAT